MSMTELHANSFQDVVTEDGVIWDGQCLGTPIPNGSYRLRTVCPDPKNARAGDVDLVWESDYAVTVWDGVINTSQACRAASHLMDCIGKRNRYLKEIWFNSDSNTLQFDISEAA